MRKFDGFKRLTAVLLVILIGACICAAALSEERVDSDYMRLSTFPQDMFPAAVLRVDIDFPPETVDVLEAEITVEAPENLLAVALTDGYHIALANWWYTPTGIGCAFQTAELRRFDGTVGLWLVLITKGE